MYNTSQSNFNNGSTAFTVSTLPALYIVFAYSTFSRSGHSSTKRAPRAWMGVTCSILYDITDDKSLPIQWVYYFDYSKYEYTKILGQRYHGNYMAILLL